MPDPGSDTNIVNGTITTTITMLGGQTLTNTVQYRQPSSGDITTGQDIYTYLDARNRSYYVTHLDGTTEQFNYACCGLDSQIDREGITNFYSYDALKRQTASMRNGITTSTILGPNNNALATIRTGTDSSQITMQSQGFDLAGRVTRETNALGGITIHTNYFDASHQLIKQATYPDGGTRIETYFQDGSVQSLSGTAVQPASYLYGVDSDGVFTTERRLDSSGGTNEWTKTSTDMLARPYKAVFAAASSPPFSISYFNALGQLTNQVDPDGASTIFAYNDKGEQAYTVLDINQNSSIDFSGADRITLVTNDVVSDHSTNVRRTRTSVWATSADSQTLVSTAETSVDGLQFWNTIWNNGLAITSHSQTFYDSAHGARIVTNTAPDGSYTVTTNQNGRTISVTSRDALNNQLTSISCGYDPHGRQNTATDARNGTTTYSFNTADQINGLSTPSPVQITTNFFDKMGRIVAAKLPDNTYVTNNYDVTGFLTNTLGSRTYPVAYTYDAQGRMKTMKRWQNFSGNSGAATTTWNYDIYRGFLTNKAYADGTGPKYTYTSSGRLATRLWARGTNTTYAYNIAGDLSAIGYSDGVTPAISYAYDRRGRQIAVTNGSTVCSLALDDAGDLLAESYSGGPLNSLTVTNIYDSLLRRTTNGLWDGSAWLAQTRYAYDSASRLRSVSDSTNSATYSYVANSPLVSQIAFTNGTVQRMVTTKTYDYLNRLTQISSASSAVSFSYSYNSANQRTSVTNAESSYWVYHYDSLGQVISGKKSWSDGTPVAGQQFEYGFDDIGNRKTTAAGGDQYGANLRYANYSANNLNQYTSRSIPAYENVIGSANSNATVTIWNSDGAFAQTYRRGEYFRGEFPFNNTTGAVWLALTNFAVLQSGTNANIVTNDFGNVFVPQTAESFSYDLDGNVTNDGRWVLAWDGENHLTRLESTSVAPAGSERRLTFGYDYQGRRITKSVEIWSGSAWTMVLSNKFLYDGWNLIAELNGTNNAVDRSYMWGLDLNGTSQRAGGVGGLLAVNDSVQGAQFTALDGNGNVAALIKVGDGMVSANYEYGPFGEIIRATGPMAKANPFLFSTKFYDWEPGLYYYGFRYYNPSTGRWIGRDPAGEEGGKNLYGFVQNNPANSFDLFGLLDYYLGNTDPTYTPPPTGQKPIAPTIGIRARWLALDGAAVAALALYPHASGFLSYYLNGDGTPVKVSVDDMVNETVNAKTVYRAELTQAMKFAGTLAKKPNGDYDIDSRTTSQGEFVPSDSPDWFLAIGRYVGWGKGKVHVKDCKVTLDFTFEFRKRYQWQVDKGKSVPFLGFSITDAQMGELSEAGLAKEFDITGEKSETIIATGANDAGPSLPPPTGR